MAHWQRVAGAGGVEVLDGAAIDPAAGAAGSARCGVVLRDTVPCDTVLCGT